MVDWAKAEFVDDQCLSVVRQLAEYDRQLSQNLEVEEDDRLGRKKIAAAEAGITSDAWVEVLNSEENSKGTIFSCGYSSAWVGEVFTGLTAQFPEFQNYFADLPAAVDAGSEDAYVYVDATGDKLAPFFEANADANDKRVTYRFKQTGMIDHVWLVEQLSNDGGFRVYQSYNGAYSLGAWLSTNIVDGMYGPDDEGYDMVDWTRVRDSFNGVLGTMCNNTVASLDDAEMIDATTCPDLAAIGPIEVVKDWIVYVKNYDETEMKANFEKSWNLYGKGMTIPSADFKAGYLADLATLSASMAAAAADPTAEWTTEMHDMWIELFASPSPMNWPGIPFATVPSMNGLSGYQLEVSIVQTDAGTDATDTCCKNGQILADTIPSETVTIECSADASTTSGGDATTSGGGDANGSSGGTSTSDAGRVPYNGWLYSGFIVTAVFGIGALSM
jgi:hypothetical protein